MAAQLRKTPKISAVARMVSMKCILPALWSFASVPMRSPWLRIQFGSRPSRYHRSESTDSRPASERLVPGGAGWVRAKLLRHYPFGQVIRSARGATLRATERYRLVAVRWIHGSVIGRLELGGSAQLDQPMGTRAAETARCGARGSRERRLDAQRIPTAFTRGDWDEERIRMLARV